jgi:hypothetical protein
LEFIMNNEEERTAGDLRPHWVSNELAEIVETGNANRICNHLARLIKNDPRFEAAVLKALNDKPHRHEVGPSAAQRVRVAVGELILNYGDEG